MALEEAWAVLASCQAFSKSCVPMDLMLGRLAGPQYSPLSPGGVTAEGSDQANCENGDDEAVVV